MSVAIVTGGGGGIGRAIAQRLAQNGADVAVIDIDAELGAETIRLLEGSGHKAIFVRADVSNSADVERYVDAAERKLGPVTAFVNNAGVEGVVAPITEYPDAEFDRLLSINVKGVFLGLKYMLIRMRARGVGAVVNIASTSAIRGRAGLAGYVTSKHAVLGLTRVAALDMAGTAIRVNAVLPGPVKTRMSRFPGSPSKRVQGKPSKGGECSIRNARRRGECGRLPFVG